MDVAPLGMLLLADGRFPAGGHVHSAGVEAAVADGRVRDLDSLTDYVHGRLATAGLTDAALAAATTWRLAGGHVAGVPSVDIVLAELDAEADARFVAPVLRVASRRLGHQLARVARRCWNGPALDALADFPDGVHQSVALGAVAATIGMTPLDVARLSLHHAVQTPAQAAVRLLGLDPFAVTGMLAATARVAEGVAREATASAGAPLHELPARSGLVVELAAIEHERWDVRMFST